MCCDEKPDVAWQPGACDAYRLVRSSLVRAVRAASQRAGLLCSGGVPLDVRLTDQRSSVRRSG